MRRQPGSCHEAGHGYGVAAVAAVGTRGQQSGHYRMLHCQLRRGTIVESHLDSSACGRQHPQVGVLVSLHPPRAEGFIWGFKVRVCISAVALVHLLIRKLASLRELLELG